MAAREKDSTPQGRTSDDDLGLFDNESESPNPSRWRAIGWRKITATRRGKTIVLGSLCAVVLLLGWLGYYFAGTVLGIGAYGDYSGNGDSDVLVQIQTGASTKAIGATLVDADVVRTARAFVNAAGSNDQVANVQPGYYVMKTKMSGHTAVDKLVDPASRVGNLQITAGLQLDDTRNPDNSVKPGIFSLVAKASCVTLNGVHNCVSANDVHHAAETADPSALGVPDWALSAVSKADPKHRLEGLIAAGVYDIKPGTSAQEILKAIITASANKLASLPDSAQNTGFTPYQVLVVASLVEREAIEPDFAKVARVIYNRLAQGMMLQDDSTINYVLDQPLITTSDADRNRPGPYNTYLNTGLTPTPISSPSQQAIDAALKPADGTWLYFVKCDKQGKSCFATTETEHEQNVQQARAAGAF